MTWCYQQLVSYTQLSHRASLECVYGWFSWGVGSLLEAKGWDPCSAQLSAKYRIVSTTSKIKEAAGERSVIQLPLDCMFALRK